MRKRRTHALESAYDNHGRKVNPKKKPSAKSGSKGLADIGSNLPPHIVEKGGLLIHCGARVGESIDIVEEIRRQREERAEQKYYGDPGKPMSAQSDGES